jgi:hypothetical protein
VQDDFFDSNNTFIGGSHVVSPPFSYSFFINGIIKAGFIDPNSKDSCAIAGSDLKGVCIYAPPAVWSSPAIATTIPNIVSVSGHYSNGDQRDIMIVSSSDGTIHDVFWKSGQQGIEGEEVVPVNFGQNDIAATSGFLNTDAHRHVVIVATNQGKIHEIFWKELTVGIEGHDVFPVSFDPGTIEGVAGFYNSDTKRHIVIVATNTRIVGTPPFGVIVGKLHEIFWKADTVGIEGHDDVPVSFVADAIKGVAAFYDANARRHVVIVGTSDGNVYQIYWKADTVGIEVSSVIARFDSNSIVGVGGFYSDNDQFEHAIVGTTDGKVFEWFTTFGQIVA